MRLLGRSGETGGNMSGLIPYFRPTEVDCLLGDPTKVREKLGWQPKVSFRELVRMMLEHDFELARQERTLKEAGHTVSLRGIYMDKHSKVYVAGHSGLVGSAIVRKLQAEGYVNLITRAHTDLDLIDQAAVWDFFGQEQPEYVFLAAAKVGGIWANDMYPADFIRDNLFIQSNVVDAAYRRGVKKLLFMGSSCIYPKHAPQPMKEEHLLTGSLEPTNEWYAVAKIAGIKMCQAYRRQYGFHAITLMPTNLYGPGDNFDLQTSHVLPALIHKFHDAEVYSDPQVAIWGRGRLGESSYMWMT